MTPIYVPPTRFSVHPLVALAPAAPTLTPSPDEVAALLPVPLAALFDATNRRVGSWDTVFGLSDVPYYAVLDASGAEHRVWGATAMMLAELGLLAHP